MANRYLKPKNLNKLRQLKGKAFKKPHNIILNALIDQE